MEKAKSVDAYLDAATEPARLIMQELRDTIQTTIPNSEEQIKYNVPFYNYHGEFVGFSVHKKHVSFGFGADVLSDEARMKLEEAGYKLGKGTLQIRFDQHVPKEAVKQILRKKAESIEERR
ncbi:iron chaperone [Listeria grayi]|uniref:Uncharacterized conserved protein n=1 Tax=Listeria grayi TaxID=1641 RepID=A0A378MBG0_LISGR|nr:DUF1801 domain-containing protein [Listeria grayi]MBC1920989.1 DUF1801 domain-containing protein [Listeria grayi]STY43661.1 Uncharacterized conserved protein [Listeria grayi]